MSESPESRGRDVLPIPDRAARRPDHLRRQGPGHRLPADRAAAAAGGRAQRAGRPARRRRLRRLERLRRPDRHADRRAAGRRRAEVHPLPHHRAVLADPAGAADRPQPPLGRHGRHHRDRHLGARLQLAASQHRGAAGRDAEAQRLRHGPVRQVPRGAGLGDQPDGPVRRLAHRAAASSTSTASSAARPTSTTPAIYTGHRAGRARPHARGGLPLHRGHDRPGHRLGAPAEGADAGQALLHLLRPRRHPRPAPRPDGVGRQVQGPVRRRAGTRCARRPSPARRSSA